MKNEFKILLCLACLLLVLEAGARVFETLLSKDVQHLRELPAQAEKLRAASQDAFKILVLGNSLARCGVDVPLLTKELKQQLQREVVVAVMHPDGSRVEEWAYGYRRFFQQAGAVPDVVLLITGRVHLTDQLKSVSDMGAFYVSGQDTGFFAQSSLHGIEDTSRFWVARASALFAHADRVQPLVFYRFVPGYDATAQGINQSASRALTAGSPHAAKPLTCQTLAFFLDGSKPSGARFLIASAPMPEPYSLPVEVMETATRAGASVVEAGKTLALPVERFPDRYHLDDPGAEAFTRFLLPPILNLAQGRP
jgi:hypothetical protein